MAPSFLRESCGSPRRTDARRLLTERLAAIETRRFIPRESQVTVAHLLDAVETHLEMRGLGGQLKTGH